MRSLRKIRLAAPADLPAERSAAATYSESDYAADDSGAKIILRHGFIFSPSFLLCPNTLFVLASLVMAPGGSTTRNRSRAIPERGSRPSSRLPKHPEQLRPKL